MQTFLPVADPYECGMIIDPMRLGNQIWRESKTLYNDGWPNHPAYKMWASNKVWLAYYNSRLSRAAIKRNLFGPGTALKWYRFWRDECKRGIDAGESTAKPSWLGLDVIHSSHRANLLRKDPVYYGKFGWSEVPMDGYVWPQDDGTLVHVVNVNGKSVRTHIN